MRVVVPLLVLFGCPSESEIPPADPPDDPHLTTTPLTTCDDPTLTWANAGQPFLTTWCDSCHGAEKVGIERLGAPDAVRFDTLAETRAFEARIEVRVLGEIPTMPPATNLPASAVERFATWVACGLPGEEVPEPPAELCAEVVLAPGDVRVSTMDPAFCDSWSGVDGDLVIDAASPILDCLCEVTGHVTVAGFAGDTLTLPVLAHAESFAVEGGPALTALDLPELLALDGTLALADLPVLESAELPLLASVGGDVVVTRSNTLGTLGVHRLAEVGGSVRLVGVEAMDGFLPFDSLEAIGGDLELWRTGITEPRDFRRLAEIGGSLMIGENQHLVSLAGYDVLARVGRDFGIARNPGLMQLEPMPLLETVGRDVQFLANPSLARRQAGRLIEQIDAVGGNIVVSGCAP